jgi:hypothetical protein
MPVAVEQLPKVLHSGGVTDLCTASTSGARPLIAAASESSLSW